jgi:hypothetical protein
MLGIAKHFATANHSATRLGGRSMKNRAVLCVTLAVMLVGFIGHNAIAGGSAVPSPGQFSIRGTGSFAVCLNPTTFVDEACTTSGVLVYPITDVENGTIYKGSNGNICEDDASVYAALPPNVQPSSFATSHTAGTLTDYDPTTGQGNYSITGYSGGKCIGSSFDSSGATKTGTGTVHIVETSPDRVDFIVTSFTAAPLSDVESFSLSGYELRQHK